MPPPGNFVTKDGKVLGQHKGITHYTIGQRKGLGIALGVPMFVAGLRPDTNEVVLGGNEEVFGTALSGDKLNLMSIPDLEGELEVTAKIRYNHKGAPCTIRKSGEGRVFCQFHEPVRAITPGQAVTDYSKTWQKRIGRGQRAWFCRVRPWKEAKYHIAGLLYNWPLRQSPNIRASVSLACCPRESKRKTQNNWRGCAGTHSPFVKISLKFVG